MYKRKDRTVFLCAYCNIKLDIPDGCDLPPPCYCVFTYPGAEEPIASAHNDLFGCCFGHDACFVVFFLNHHPSLTYEFQVGR